MRGRQLYRLARPALRALTFAARCLPRPARGLLLTLARPIPTIAGVFIRYPLVASLARSCGDCVTIFENVYLHHIDRLDLGSNVSIHPLCYLDALGGVSIGSDVSIAHNCTVLSAEHDYLQPDVPIRDAPVLTRPTAIGSDVWLGAGVRVLGGVTIENRSVVGAGSVVTKDVPSGTVAVGVPAKPKLAIPTGEDEAAATLPLDLRGAA